MEMASKHPGRPVRENFSDVNCASQGVKDRGYQPTSQTFWRQYGDKQSLASEACLGRWRIEDLFTLLDIGSFQIFCRTDSRIRAKSMHNPPHVVWVLAVRVTDALILFLMLLI